MVDPCPLRRRFNRGPVRHAGLFEVVAGQLHAMTDQGSSPEKPVDEWVTGGEPMTGPQRSYLETLARDAGVDVPDTLSKAEASEMIERLQRTTGRRDPDESDEASQLPLVEDLAEQGIVDQQAATDVAPRDPG